MGRVISYLLFSNKNRHRQKQNKRLFNIYLNYYTKMYYKEFQCFTCFYIGSNRSEYFFACFYIVICDMLYGFLFNESYRCVSNIRNETEAHASIKRKKNNTSLAQYLSEDQSKVKTGRNTKSNVYNQAYTMMYYLKHYH